MVVIIFSRRIKVISSFEINNYYYYITDYEFFSEYILDFFAVWLTKFYNVTLLIPRWLLVFGSGTFASLLIGFLHKSPNPPVAIQSQSTVSTTTASLKSTDAPAQSDEAKRTGAKQRKSRA
jgi:hypothetical protein